MVKLNYKLSRSMLCHYLIFHFKRQNNYERSILYVLMIYIHLSFLLIELLKCITLFSNVNIKVDKNAPD